MAKELKIGDLVKVFDGSSAVRIDKYESCSAIGLCKDKFEVIFSGLCGTLEFDHRTPAHDIIIVNTVTGKRYLHSAALVNLIDPPVKEVTMAQVEAAFNCKVKIIK